MRNKFALINDGGFHMENLLDKKQVAAHLRISVKTLDARIAQGLGPQPLYLGRMVRFRQSDVQAFIQNLSAGGEQS
jgi:predicted DNA-binding transcriptional regulator AlpA